MSTRDESLTTQIEALIDEATEEVVGWIRDAEAEMGDRPAGFTKADILDQLSIFLAIKDDPQAWAAMVASWVQTRGITRREALKQAVREFTRLDRALRHRGGVEAVQRMIAHRHLARIEPQLKRLETLDARPKIRILPPERVPTFEEILAPPPGAFETPDWRAQPPPDPDHYDPATADPGAEPYDLNVDEWDDVGPDQREQEFRRALALSRGELAA